MRFLRSFFASVVKFLYVAPLREAVIALKELPAGMRLLGWAGYAGTFLLLAVTVIAAFPGVDLGVVTFPTLVNGETVMASIPVLVIVAGLAGLLLGWAYLLTGATNSQPLIFLPFAALFCVQLTCLMPLGASSGLWWLAWLCVIPPLVFAISMVHLFTYKKAFWHSHPLLEFGLWAFVLCLAALFFWFGRQDLVELTAGLDGTFNLLVVFFLPLWMFLGVSIVDLAVELASRIVFTLRRLFPALVIQSIALFVLISRPAMLPILYLADSLYQPDVLNVSMDISPLATGIFIDAALSIPLLVVLVILLLTRRWDGYRAAKLLALSLALPVFAIGYTFGLGGLDLSNPLELTVRGIGVLPSVLVFVVMLVYNVFGLGARFARGDNRLLPRQGRVLLVFGLALLVTSLVIFLTNMHDTTGALLGGWETSFGSFFTLGLVLLGLPYLAWVAWKRGERLAGPREEFENTTSRLAALSFTSRRKWVLVAVLSALTVLLISCLLVLLFVH